MPKKGMSHIEVILAFVLFMGAVIFLSFIFNPKAQKTDFSDQTNQIMGNLEENASADVTEIGIKMIRPEQGNISIMIINYSTFGSGASAQDPTGNQILAQGAIIGKSDIICLSNSDGIPSFFYVRLSKDIIQYEGIIGNCQAENNSYYEMAAINERKIVSENELMAINNSYYFDYYGLKKTLNIPDSKDFSFQAAFADGMVIQGNKNITYNTEIYALNKNVEILRTNGNLEFAKLGIRIW